jgi:phage shock protein C
MRKKSPQGFRERRRQGWGMGLFRNRADGWIGGVCAGLGDHWDVPYWMVRLGVLALFFATGAFWFYIIAWIFMAPRPTRWDDARSAVAEDEVEIEMEYDEEIHTYRPKKVFRYSDSPSVRLRKARSRLDDALARVEAMERYVTSPQYDLNREFSKL